MCRGLVLLYVTGKPRGSPLLPVYTYKLTSISGQIAGERERPDQREEEAPAEMVNYWKSKLLPSIKKVFDKNGKKAAAAEAVKSFDESKEEIGKVFEEKKGELQPKVVEIYEASAVEIKTLVKKPTEAGLKKKSPVVIKFIDELVKIEFPGSKPVSEAATKYGAGHVSGPVVFIFEKVVTLLPADEPPAASAAAVETTTKEITPDAAEEIKKEELVEEASEAAPPPPSDPAEPAPEAEPAAEPAKA